MLPRSFCSFCAVASVCILAGCATPHVVQSVKMSDSSLSCKQIITEMAEADRFRSDAQKEKGVTGTNAAALVFSGRQ